MIKKNEKKPEPRANESFQVNFSLRSGARKESSRNAKEWAEEEKQKEPQPE
jgi:hypothetical protein